MFSVYHLVPQDTTARENPFVVYEPVEVTRCHTPLPTSEEQGAVNAMSACDFFENFSSKTQCTPTSGTNLALYIG